MKTLNKFILTIIFSSLFITPLFADDFLNNIGIFVNNRAISFENGCNLDLDINDVIKIVGRYEPNKVIEIKAFDETYRIQTNENGDWLLLFSVPYTTQSDYDLRIKSDTSDEGKSFCKITLQDNLTQGDDEINKNEDSKYLIIGISILIFTLSLVSFFILKRNTSKK